MDTTSRQKRLTDNAPAGFTLVELLVVITIIGILAALITVAAIGALKQMRRTAIKADINETSNGLDEYRNKFTAYPPNCQTDAGGPLDDAGILNDVRRHIKQLAPRSQESENLSRMLVGFSATSGSFDEADYKTPLTNGVAADEAVVFWLGGFSSDPKYPISGEGGPSYAITALNDATNASKDPIESRKWIYPFDVTRLGPRDSTTGYFNGRFVEYKAPTGQLRRINFWHYKPSHSEQPYLYFDTSRHPVGTVSTSNMLKGTYDPPAATYPGAGDLGNVYAFKKAAETPAIGAPAIQYINPDKFQVFHCGIDDAWDKASFLSMAPKSNSPNVASGYLLFPSGPFIGDISDTEVNFATQTTIEDAAK